MLDNIFRNSFSILNNINSCLYIDVYFFMFSYIFIYFPSIFLVYYFFHQQFFSCVGFVEYFTYFSLALKYINYLGVGVCGLSLLLNSHTFSCELCLSFSL